MIGVTQRKETNCLSILITNAKFANSELHCVQQLRKPPPSHAMITTTSWQMQNLSNITKLTVDQQLHAGRGGLGEAHLDNLLLDKFK